MSTAATAGRSLSAEGFAFIPGDDLFSRVRDPDSESEIVDNRLATLRHHFEGLAEDPYSPGRRFRSYAQCRLGNDKEIIFGQFEEYMQTAAYNPDTGGVVRRYPLLSEDLQRESALRRLIEWDADVVRHYGSIGDPWLTAVGVHFFRYWATPERPAFSSPIWLHRDDEDVVFVHLVGRSENAVGGDSIIASSARQIERVIPLASSGDTLVVDHQKFHAVSPVGCWPNASPGRGRDAFRDVILVTFQRRETLGG